MKTFFVILGVVIAIAIAFIVVCLTINVKNQATIVRVFSEQSKAAITFQEELKASNGKKQSLSELQMDLKTYAQALQSIDASLCPKDFRLAWFDYVSSVTDLSNKNFGVSAFGDVFEIAMSAWTKDGKLAENAVRDTNVLKPANLFASLPADCNCLWCQLPSDCESATKLKLGWFKFGKGISHW
jgi:hypothetical protein